MLRIQPLSWLGRQNQANHWRYGLYLAYQVLAFALLALWGMSTQADPQYFTWVDEFGRVHNSPLNTATQEKQNFLTEQQLEQKIKQNDDAAFYTWVDERGLVHNQLQRAVVPSEAKAESLVASFEHSLIPPERLTSAQAQGCCNQYLAAFTHQLSARKPLSLQPPARASEFSFQGRVHSAYFIQLNRPRAVLQEPLTLTLKAWQSQRPLAFVALNNTLEPLYLIPQVKQQAIAETWRSLAYRESLIELVDADIAAIIVFFPQDIEPQASFELRLQ